MERTAGEVDAGVDRVAMGVDEAWQQRPATQIDPPCPGADELVHVAGGADGDEQAVADGDRFRGGMLGVHRHDRPANKDEVGGACPARHVCVRTRARA
jgi:hypothetical protein